MTFDPTINIGNILSLIAGIATFLLYLRKLEKRMDKIDEDVRMMRREFALVWKWFKKEHNINGSDE